MYNGMKMIFAFTLGAAVGSAATWWVLKKKYEKMAQEDVEEVRAWYKEKYEDDTHDDIYEEDTYEENTAREYSSIVQDYENDMNKKKKGGSDTMEIGTEPYVISPEEFEENEDYDTQCLTYYNDGVLADDNDIPIDDVDAVIGFESLERFGEYEKDMLYVRNDRLKCDYEICMDLREFSEVIASDLNLKDYE